MIKRKKKLNVTVLMGGPSSEYEVSLNTGRMITETLDKKKYNTTPVIVTKSREWLIGDIPNDIKLLGSPDRTKAKKLSVLEESGLKKLKDNKTDIVFIAMHGKYGEDGTIQGLLETPGLPYTGSGVLASALGMDKPKSLALFIDGGLLVPEFAVIEKNKWSGSKGALKKEIIGRFKLPLVIKPADGGSSVGLSIIRKLSDFDIGIKKTFSYSDLAMIQKYIPGRELTCGVIDDGGRKAMALLPTEIVPKSAFFDYHSKYTPGGAKEITPPDLPHNVIKEIQRIAMAAHKIIGCSGMSRTDMILSKDGKLYVLEINTIPGMTETSLLPQAAKASGISFAKLLDKIIAAGLRKNKRV